MNITSNKFGFEIEVSAKVCNLQCATYAVPVSYHRVFMRKVKRLDSAFWYVTYYNWLVSTEASFRALRSVSTKS